MSGDPPITHEQLALSLETVRAYVGAVSAMMMATGREDFAEHVQRFEKMDEMYLQFIATLRGER